MNLRRLFTGTLAGALLLSCGLVRAADLTPSAQAPAAAATTVSAQAGSATQTAEAKPKVHKHKPKPQAAPDAVPDFTLIEVGNGKTFHLRDHLGEVVLIDFWATWCGPCRMAIPHLIELQKKYKNRGFTVVGVSLDQQGPDVVRTFTEQWKVNYPVVVDMDGGVARTYGGVRAIPTTVVIDATGRVVGDPLIGYRPLEDYEALIKQALRQS
jgi:thiol-disulfide isomerase/thioredoxin